MTAAATAIEYTAPWPVYALTWSSPSSNSSRRSKNTSGSGSNSKAIEPLDQFNPAARIAIGSIVEDYSNKIQVIGAGLDENGHPCLKPLADASHPYPATKLAFQPGSLSQESSSSGGGGSSSGARNYSSPSSRFAKRTSWALGGQQASEDVEEEEDVYPDRELLASTADSLRIWEVHRNDGQEDGSGDHGYVGKEPNRLPFVLREKSVLAHSKSSASPPAPLTSFSWNSPSPNLIVTASIDTTCTIWDLPTRTALTQLIAHDREVYDVDWCPGSADVFASVGADGSVRVFDLRSLEHSTIIYEMGNSGDASRPGTALGSPSDAGGSPSNPTLPLLRIAFNPWDANYLATFHLESDCIQILDVRAPGSPILELRGHSAAVNAVAWGPPGGAAGTSKGMVATAGDDSQCLVYDLATSTLRSASAQGRRSRNSHAGPSPAPSSSLGYSVPQPSATPPLPRVGSEMPFLAASLPEMVNNVAWLRTATPSDKPSTSRKSSVVQEWDDYTRGMGKEGKGDADWLAMASGRLVRAAIV